MVDIHDCMKVMVKLRRILTSFQTSIVYIHTSPLQYILEKHIRWYMIVDEMAIVHTASEYWKARNGGQSGFAS